MRRRDFLTATMAASGLSLVRVGSHAWAAQNPSEVTQRLVVVFLRGAVDGLNVVIPHTEHAYYAMRPTIAVAPPGHQDGGLELVSLEGLPREQVAQYDGTTRLASVDISGAAAEPLPGASAVRSIAGITSASLRLLWVACTAW